MIRTTFRVKPDGTRITVRMCDSRDEATTPQAIPAGAHAWFVCRAQGIVDDVEIPLRAKSASEAEIAKRGRMVAARQFKRRHGLHPCTKVDCEFQGVES